MVDKKVIVLMCLVVFTSCFRYYYIKEDKNGEPVIGETSYSFNNKMTKENLQVIDTAGFYLELVDDLSLKGDNPSILIFHNDGTYEIRSKKYFRNFEKERMKQSVFYGGRFILDNNNLRTERFYPSAGGKTNYYIKKISTGIVKNDTIILNVFDSKQIYIKKNYNDIFEDL